MAKFYVTTPIYYVNDRPHVGHAYTTIAADVLARYHRLLGDATFFLAGTDEHGIKNLQSAQKADLDPQAFVDRQAAQFQLAWDSLDITNDDFIRTTQPRHKKAVENFLQNLSQAITPLGNKAVYQGEYEGLYCTGCESYKTESDLVDGKCPDHNKAPELLKEKNWFFRLSDFTEAVRKVISDGTVVIAPTARHNEIVGLLDQGLKDVAMSRHLDWGVKLPFDDSQVAWVWFDALPNYISALGYPDDEKFKTYWPADVHLMAKDIIKFHTVIWLGMLLALNLPLPKKVFAHGFFTVDGQKMSKTIGNVIDPVELTAQYGSDVVRFFLLSEFAFGSDGDVSVVKFKERYASSLANGLGNLVARVLALAAKNPDELLVSQDGVWQKTLDQTWSDYRTAMDELQFHEAIGAIWRTLAEADAFIETNKPWELFKNDQEKFNVVIGELCEVLRHVGWLLLPFMPQTSEKILTALGVWSAEKKLAYQHLSTWTPRRGWRLQKVNILFPRLES